MRRLVSLAFVAGTLAHCAAWSEAKPTHILVTRHAADWYVSADGQDFHTVSCTQTATLMDAKVVRWHGKRWLVFLDKHGEDEGECQLR